MSIGGFSLINTFSDLLNFLRKLFINKLRIICIAVVEV